MRIRSLAPLLWAHAGCTWTPADTPGAGAPANVIAGEIVANGVTDPSYAVVLVTNANNLPPPAGTGRPASFAGVSPRAFTGAGAGVQAAAYQVSNVPDGSYVVTGFMDMDRDFHPSIDAMGGATCGDVAGAHLADITRTDLAAVTVRGGELLDDVTVALGSVFPVERPAFYPGNSAGQPLVPSVSVGAAVTAAIEGGLPESYHLFSTAIHAGFSSTVAYHLDGPYAVAGINGFDVFRGEMTCETAFYAWVKDADEDGYPDDNPDAPGRGLFDIWPRVGITFLGTPADSDDDQIPDTFLHELEPGESWVSRGVVSPLMVLTGRLPVGAPVLTDHLEIVFLPGAQHTFRSREDACGGEWIEGTCTVLITDPTVIPRGAWAITVISETGQTWTVPNRSAAAVSLDETTFVPVTQGLWLDVRN